MIDIEQQELVRTIYRPNRVDARLLLAHGAGAGNKHEFMDELSKLIAGHNIEVTSFNFPYMQIMYELDKRRPPNKFDKLVEHFHQELTNLQARSYSVPTYIGGKSMGGRVASLLASQPLDGLDVSGLVVFGYPFIPPGKPEKLAERMAHFDNIKCESLILQGDRDNFGGRELLDSLNFPSQIKVEWLESGDHSFKPLKASGLSHRHNMMVAATQTVNFILGSKRGI